VLLSFYPYLWDNPYFQNDLYFQDNPYLQDNESFLISNSILIWISKKKEWVWLRLYFLQAIGLLHYKYWSQSMWKKKTKNHWRNQGRERKHTRGGKRNPKTEQRPKNQPKKIEKKSRENRAKNPEQRNNTQREWEERNTAYIENCHRHSLHLCRHPCTKKTPKPVTESRHLHHHLRSSWKNKAYGHRSKKKQRERS